MNFEKQTVLILSLPNFDRRYLYQKEMGSGYGYRSLRPSKFHDEPRKIYPIAELQYAAAIVKDEGHNVVLDDDQYRDSIDIEEYKISLKKRCKSPSVIFVRTSLPTLFYDLEIGEDIKKIYPNVPLYIFGPLFSAPEFIDFVKTNKTYDGLITSEIEAVISKIINKKDPKEIPGFYYKKDGNYICHNNERALANMEKLPLPSYESVDYKKIDRFIIHSSRGCPKACNYCPYYISQGGKFRSKTAERTFEEIKYLVENFKAKKLVIHDPIFTLDKNRIIKLCELLAEAKLNITWECETHMDHLDPPLIALMYKAGLRLLAYGVESANKDVLKKARRGFKNWKKLKENIDAAKEIGIVTRAYFILGLPGDNIEGAYASIELAKFIGSDISQFSLPNPYPGTEMFRNGLRDGWLDKQKYDNDKELFYRSLGTHGHNEPSMTEHYNSLQAKYIKCIANHEMINQGENGIKKIVRRFKIISYETALQGIDKIQKIRKSLSS